MYCPTCASPLPVGAMFCGECGRAVSSADLAAARRRADAAAERVDATSATDLHEPPPRSTSHPHRGDGAEPPWWVRDRQIDTQADSGTPSEPGDTPPVRPASVPEPPAWPVSQPPVAEPPVAEVPAAEQASAEASRVERAGVAGPVDEQPPVERRPADEEARVDPSRDPRPQGRAAAPPTDVPVPLRSPSRHPDDGPRPTSAPLWTASLSPVEPTEPADTGAAPQHTASERSDEDATRVPDPGSAADEQASDEPVNHEDADSDHGTGSESASGTPTDGVAAEVGDEVATGDDQDAPGAPAESRVDAPALVRPTVEAPRDGDTAPVAALSNEVRAVTPVRPPAPPAETARPTPVPLVEPAPLVEPGSASAPERCTHCGAAIGEDDIFCGECGAVVQSVALSFTGPVVPLPPGWRPDDQSTPRPSPTTDERADAGTETGTADPLPAPGPGPVPEPIDHVPGFRAERPAVTPPPTVADVPPAPTSSSAPAWRSRRPPVDLPEDDDVDETRIVRRGGAGVGYVLQFSTGESIAIDGTGLVGRAPTPQPGERFDQLVRIVDPGKSVSKTHLEFGQEAGALWISDRWSGNGTVVRPRDLPPRRADPGVRVRVTRGTRVEIGEQFFVVV